MKIYPIETGNFKLDGGAMFGVVPKTIWQKTNPADSNNLIDMSMRCMLIEDGDRLLLIDTGLGEKQSAKFYGYYYIFGDFYFLKLIVLKLNQWSFRNNMTIHDNLCKNKVTHFKQVRI
jgi:hypothetical protein